MFDIPRNPNRGYNAYACEKAAIQGRKITAKDIKADWARHGFTLTTARAREEAKRMNLITKGGSHE